MVIKFSKTEYTAMIRSIDSICEHKFSLKYMDACQVIRSTSRAMMNVGKHLGFLGAELDAEAMTLTTFWSDATMLFDLNTLELVEVKYV